MSQVKVWLVGDINSVCSALHGSLEAQGGLAVLGRSYQLFDAEAKASGVALDVMLVDQSRLSVEELCRFVGRVSGLTRMVVLCCDQRTAQMASESGAVVCVLEGSSQQNRLSERTVAEIVAKITRAAATRSQAEAVKKTPSTPSYDGLICIGASTGGTEATYKLLKELPPGMPPMLIVQHMPLTFTGMYAERLDKTTPHRVRQAQDKDVVERGEILLAPGDKHMRLVRSDGQYRVECFTADKVNGHRPSVDVLFESVAVSGAKHVIGVLLTGMGGDGAKGMLSMRRAGAYTFGQDESSCVVYGMPKEARNIGAVCAELPLASIPQAMLSYMLGKSAFRVPRPTFGGL